MSDTCNYTCYLKVLLCHVFHPFYMDKKGKGPCEVWICPRGVRNTWHKMSEFKLKRAWVEELDTTEGPKVYRRCDLGNKAKRLFGHCVCWKPHVTEIRCPLHGVLLQWWMELHSKVTGPLIHQHVPSLLINGLLCVHSFNGHIISLLYAGAHVENKIFCPHHLRRGKFRWN